MTRPTAVRAMQAATRAEKAPGVNAPWYRTPYGWDRKQSEVWWREREEGRQQSE